MPYETPMNIMVKFSRRLNCALSQSFMKIQQNPMWNCGSYNDQS